MHVLLTAAGYALLSIGGVLCGMAAVALNPRVLFPPRVGLPGVIFIALGLLLIAAGQG